MSTGGYIHEHIYNTNQGTPGDGTVTSVTVDSPNDTVSVSNGTVTTTGTVHVDINGKPPGDVTNSLGVSTARWTGVVVKPDGFVAFDQGSGQPKDYLEYTAGTGPAFEDGTTTKILQFDVQDLTDDRTASWPDKDGEVTLLGNTVTGTNNIVLSTAPTMVDPVVGTQDWHDISTKAASTQFVNTAIEQGGTSVTDITLGGSTNIGVPELTVITCYVFTASGTVPAWELHAIDDGTIPGQLVFLTFQRAVTSVTWTATNIDAAALPLVGSFTAGQCIGLQWNDDVSKWLRWL